MDRRKERAGAAATATGSTFVRSAELTRPDNAAGEWRQSRIRCQVHIAAPDNTGGKQAAEPERRAA